MSKKKLPTKTCPVCEVPIWDQSTYCRKHAAPSRYAVKVCETCFVPFQPTSGRQLRCKECRGAA